jgi:hypothetical protein
MRNSPRRRTVGTLALLLGAATLAGCETSDGVSVSGSVGMYYGSGGFYDPWYGPGYYPPPPIVVVPPPARPERPPPGTRPPANRPTPLPARPPMNRPMPRRR